MFTDVSLFLGGVCQEFSKQLMVMHAPVWGAWLLTSQRTSYQCCFFDSEICDDHSKLTLLPYFNLLVCFEFFLPFGLPVKPRCNFLRKLKKPLSSEMDLKRSPETVLLVLGTLFLFSGSNMCIVGYSIDPSIAFCLLCLGTSR